MGRRGGRTMHAEEKDEGGKVGTVTELDSLTRSADRVGGSCSCSAVR